METRLLTILSRTLSAHVSLGKTRLETLCLLVAGIISTRSVNLSHIAAERPGRVSVASTYRRLQRFFQHVRLDDDWVVPLVVSLIGSRPPWVLCLDRTNWKLGQRDVNFLVPAVATRRFRVPLMWTVLEHGGSSDTAERIALIERYLALFPSDTVRILLADREFEGQEWMGFLVAHRISFAIRLKENRFVQLPCGKRVTLGALFRKAHPPRSIRARLPQQKGGQQGHPALDLYFAAKRINGGERLIIASTEPGLGPLKVYRKRWAIECLFADAKTRGLNLEDTRLTIASKLSLLMGIVALAVAWTCRTATDLMGRAAPPRKAHGYYAKSWFRVGFDELRRRMRTDHHEAAAPLVKALKSTRVV